MCGCVACVGCVVFFFFFSNRATEVLNSNGATEDTGLFILILIPRGGSLRWAKATWKGRTSEIGAAGINASALAL